ncbi:hypothetical protein CK503_04035 [Aliifodinibius salipaludis]|uniref:Swt1-like HEPN domain-containing protein n=1 Tax=Fodinibius salipaludis TaxID=2032627 RepID=A0A2A2GF32_9BACT|nr:hypothetical protein [Aliifodinibius salipaludis]PAU95372.1 hypothetical protein CK503_04035 [Aliifodinibius salipaludis]
MATKTKKERIIKSFKDGDSPTEICKKFECTMVALRRSVNEAIGEGTLKRSDLYFSIPEEVRSYVSKLHDDGTNIHEIQLKMTKKGLDADYIELFNSLDSEDKFYGDMYEYIREIEITLHNFIKFELIKEFGKGEMNWWREIPKNIRKSCAVRREEDSNPTDFYNYTYIIDLKKIVSSHWSLFTRSLPKEWASNKNEFKRSLNKLNTIRNSVMHPIKGREWSMKDLEFIRKIHRVTKPL